MSKRQKDLSLSDSISQVAIKAAQLAETAQSSAKKTIFETMGTGDLVALTTIHVATDILAQSLQALSSTGVFVTKQTSNFFTRTVKHVWLAGSTLGKITTISIISTIKASDDIGSEAGRVTRKAILNTAALPREILEALFLGRKN